MPTSSQLAYDPVSLTIMTLIELLVFLTWVCSGIAGAMWGNYLLGWPAAVAGFIMGAAIDLCLMFLLQKIGTYFEDMLYRGRPRRPVCKAGICQLGDYHAAWTEDTIGPRRYSFQFTCKCGTRYQHVGRRFMEVLSDGSLQPYMAWKPFKGWFPDNGEPISPSASQ
jgi:hypothetical protein